MNYKLAAPLAAIGLRRLPRLHAQLAARRRHARHILDRLPPDGLLRELAYPNDSQPNYYQLVLTTTARQRETAAALEMLGLPPDSRRYRYRPLHQQPMFAPYASPCPNAEALATSTVQLPVHPNLPEATVEWMAARIATIAREGPTP